MRLRQHAESHAMHRVGWLRATVLGANDGIVSTASLIAGVAAAGSDSAAILVAGIAGLMAGALSMAAGEYVSVSSQSDTEQADIARERAELATAPEAELAELTEIYIARGLTPSIILRNALTLYLATIDGSTETERRRQFSSEYLFLGIDLLIQRQFPDAHQALMAEADRRVEALYAAS